MKPAIKSALVSISIYSMAVSWLIWSAFFGRTPNDGGIMVLLTAVPTSLLTGLIDYGALRESIAAVLHQPVSDRLAMSMDACVGWLLGCIQYGVFGIFMGKIFRSARH